MGQRGTIRLTRMAYNPESATAFGHIWKLAYHFSNKMRPELRVFADNEAAREGDWSTYGAPDGQAEVLSFDGVGDARPLRLDGETFSVRFDTLDKRLVDYPRGGPEEEPVYGFTIERLR